MEGLTIADARRLLEETKRRAEAAPPIDSSLEARVLREGRIDGLQIALYLLERVDR